MKSQTRYEIIDFDFHSPPLEAKLNALCLTQLSRLNKKLRQEAEKWNHQPELASPII